MKSILTYLACIVVATGAIAEDVEQFHMVVMDPLAAPLSCPCVEGYAQRKYEVLAKHLEVSLNRPINLVFTNALSNALKETSGQVDLIIGKDSVIRADAKEAKVSVSAVASLTGKDGATTQTGLIVVNKDDPATSVAQLVSYEIIFGPSECDEKHSAAMRLLKSNGVTIPKKIVIDEACSDGAAKVVDKGPNSKFAAVISSYAAPLLEGCGTIKKGDLRVVGRTEPVPFVAAFVSDSLNEVDRQNTIAALMGVSTHPDLLEALESLIGFLPVSPESQESQSDSSKKKTTS